MLKEANYPPKGEYYMYPCYDEDGELVRTCSKCFNTKKCIDIAHMF